MATIMSQVKIFREPTLLEMQVAINRWLQEAEAIGVKIICTDLCFSENQPIIAVFYSRDE